MRHDDRPWEAGASLDIHAGGHVSHIGGGPTGRAGVAGATRLVRSRAGVALGGLVVVAALGACASAADGDGTGRAALAGSVSQDPSPPGMASPSGDPEAEIDPGPVDPGATPVGGEPWKTEVSAVCAGAVAAEGGVGFDEVAQTSDGGAVASFWASGGRSVVCDVLTADDGTTVTTLVPSGANGSRGFDERALLLGSSVVRGEDGSPTAVRYVAGGRLPWRVDELGYAFPDGRRARAVFVESTDGSGDVWWSVGYTATEGPLADPATDPADVDPLTVSVVGAAAEAFRLSWGDAQRSE